MVYCNKFDAKGFDCNEVDLYNISIRLSFIKIFCAFTGHSSTTTQLKTQDCLVEVLDLNTEKYCML